jgi:hypothetical protein
MHAAMCTSRACGGSTPAAHGELGAVLDVLSSAGSRMMLLIYACSPVCHHGVRMSLCQRGRVRGWQFPTAVPMLPLLQQAQHTTRVCPSQLQPGRHFHWC